MSTQYHFNDGWELVDTKTGAPIQDYQELHTFRGERVKLLGWSAPKHEGSSGRVFIRPWSPENARSMECFPSVVNCTIQRK